MDRYELEVTTDHNPPIVVAGPWPVIAATLQTLTKTEYALDGVAHIEVKRV